MQRGHFPGNNLQPRQIQNGGGLSSGRGSKGFAVTPSSVLPTNQAVATSPVVDPMDRFRMQQPQHQEWYPSAGVTAVANSRDLPYASELGKPQLPQLPQELEHPSREADPMPVAPVAASAGQWRTTGPTEADGASQAPMPVNAAVEPPAAHDTRTAAFEKIDTKGPVAEQGKQTPQVTDGFRENAAKAIPVVEAPPPLALTKQPEEDQNEPEPEEPQAAPVDEARERTKARLAAGLVIAFWAIILLAFSVASSGFEPPVCTDEMKEAAKPCEVCGSGTLFLPLFGEFEKDISKGIRLVLYLVGLLWCFVGIAVVCDQFMAAIEEITSAQHVVWLEVHGGARHKFHLNVWNPTVANLTLMALGSSAPEILLSVIELTGNQFFSGALGPSTIVGSAAFNLLVITAVCVSALPANTTKKIHQTGVFAITASFSIFAYLWLLVILVQFTPHKVTVSEALITFLLFPLLVCLAFMADKGWILNFNKKRGAHETSEEQILAEKARLELKFGKTFTLEVAKLMLESERQAEDRSKEVPRSTRRKEVMSSVIGGKKKHEDSQPDLLFGFKENNMTCLECAGIFKAPVTVNRPPGCTVQLRYCTRDGTARSGLRYTAAEGILTFDPLSTEAFVEVPIIDNDVWEEEEYFTIEISQLSVSGRPSMVGGHPDAQVRLVVNVCTVTILNDDLPGMLVFACDEVKTTPGETVTLAVHRIEGSTGEISCNYECEDMSAHSPKNYEASEGILTWSNGQTFANIKIPILEGDSDSVRFKVVLSNPSTGVKFDPNTDGGETNAICEVIIAGRGDGTCLTRFRHRCCDPIKCGKSFTEWKEQFVAAVYCNGSIEDQSEAGGSDWFFHILSLPWKVLFALVPPPSFTGGWLCFGVALAMIGIVTAFVGDMAGLLGCCLNLTGDITAITLVALGTSLPDTFASKAAAQQDESADNSVGNVTGSNSVNVFLGLGLPWTLGAFYWDGQGVTAQWLQHKSGDDTYESLFLADYPEGGFMVPAGSLGFSVMVFTCCACACLGLLVVRRKVYGGELGGPKQAQMRDFAIMVSLWMVYIVASIVNSVSSGG